MAGVLKGINDIVKRMPDSDVQAIDGLKAKTLMQRLSSDLKVGRRVPRWFAGWLLDRFIACAFRRSTASSPVASFC